MITVPPEIFEIEYKPGDTDNWPELHFETSDKLSGLDRYEIYIGELESPIYDLKPEEKYIKIENLKAGIHTAMIKAIPSSRVGILAKRANSDISSD